MLTSLTAEISSRPLGLARIIVGSAALIRSFVAWRVLSDLTNPDTLRAPYVDWLPGPTTPLVVGILAVWVVSGVLFTMGWRVPLTGAFLLASIVATLAIDQQTYSNHLYLMGWLVLLLTVASSGSGINLHRVDRPVVRWPVLLIMLQASIVYGFSAITKLNESFLRGEVLAGTLGHGLVPFPEGLRTPLFLSVVAALAVFVELFIAVFIWRQRFRPAAFFLGLGLHVSITLLMSSTLELLVFSLEMLALYPLFLAQGQLTLAGNGECSFCRSWVRRLTRLDLLKTLKPAQHGDGRQPLRLIHAGETSDGFRAITLTLEHLVPTLWVAPILRLPAVRNLGDRWFRSQARRRSCPASEAESIPRADSTAH